MPFQDQKLVKNLIITDMDDTLHEAERRIMAQTWNTLLAPWGIVWQADPTEPLDPHLRLVQDDERPGVGIRPIEVVKYFIEKLGLNPHIANEEALLKLGIFPEDITAIKRDWHILDLEQQKNRFGEILEKARVTLPEQIVRGYGIEEIPGAVDMIRRFKEEGYAVGIVTSGSLQYAQLVLERLGLVDTYDMLISGEMVTKAKPEPEAMELTKYVLEMVDQVEGNGDMQYEVAGMFGDSASDARFALNTGIPKVFIRKSEHLSEVKIAQLQQELGDRISFVDSWEGMGPDDLREGQAAVEGQRPSGLER